MPSRTANKDIQIIYADEKYADSFRETVGSVAREHIYIEMIDASPRPAVSEFLKKIISQNWPSYFALFQDQVIGWADIIPASNPRLSHRGFLGMGIHKGYRGKGLGTHLLTKALKHAKMLGLEKVELSVYTENARAIYLYRKFGFKDIGVIRNYRKLNGVYFDCLEMELFL